MFASYLIRLRLRDTIDPTFVNLFFNTPRYWEYISENVAGNAQPNCNASKLKLLEIPVPPLSEQKRIVHAAEQSLSRVKAARERLTRIPAILRRFRQAVLAAACSGRLTADWRDSNTGMGAAKEALERAVSLRERRWDEYERIRARASGRDEKSKGRYKPPFKPLMEELALPDTWVPATVSQVALLDVGFAFRSSEFSKTGLRLLRGENVEPGSLRWSETKYWAECPGFEHLLVREGDIILALDRPLISAGLKIARATSEDVPCLLVQRVMRFMVIEPACEEFLYLCLQRKNFVNHLSKGLTGSDLPHVTGTGVAEYTFGFPPPEEQREIVARVKNLLKLADTIEKRVSAAKGRTETLTQAILAKAFRGELVPTEAELARREGRSYESAAELLARIEAAKHEATPTTHSRTRSSQTRRRRSVRRQEA